VDITRDERFIGVDFECILRVAQRVLRLMERQRSQRPDAVKAIPWLIAVLASSQMESNRQSL
jgi:hypothetical protein